MPCLNFGFLIEEVDFFNLMTKLASPLSKFYVLIEQVEFQNDGQTGQTGQTEETEQTEQTEQIEQTEQVEQVEQTEQTGQTGETYTKWLRRQFCHDTGMY